jgi:DNA ligase D-like protein (predicted ligase)
MSGTRKLPDFVKPMLAEQGEPFDSDQHLFEIKWDGIRAMAYVEPDGYRLMTRSGNDVTSRYPELQPLADMPCGCLLDGELVVLNEEGKPDFHTVLAREHTPSPVASRNRSAKSPASFIVFDLLYQDYTELVGQPLRERRERLIDVMQPDAAGRLAISEGVIGPGQELFKQVVGRDMEGVVAKRLNSRYFPGKRTDAWIKIRKSSTTLCAIVGYMPKGDDFESLILAAEDEGSLRYVGRVGTGFDMALRDELNRLLREGGCDQPLIACPDKGAWLEPGLYCAVRYLEQTKDGILREPVFERLITE